MCTMTHLQVDISFKEINNEQQHQNFPLSYFTSHLILNDAIIDDFYLDKNNRKFRGSC